MSRAYVRPNIPGRTSAVPGSAYHRTAAIIRGRTRDSLPSAEYSMVQYRLPVVNASVLYKYYPPVKRYRTFILFLNKYAREPSSPQLGARDNPRPEELWSYLCSTVRVTTLSPKRLGHFFHPFLHRLGLVTVCIPAEKSPHHRSQCITKRSYKTRHVLIIY